MKIYILTDMEGVGGVVNRSQVFSAQPGYEKTRGWLTEEVNAAVEGAREGGATEIVVLDGHGANNAVNMLYEDLCEGAQYIQGTPWMEYLPALDCSFDGLFQIGAHAMAGTKGAILEHTMSSETWVEMQVNGKPMGEIGLGAAIAGHFDVPLLMVSGDDKACAEAAKLSSGIECAVVKYGISRHCAKLVPMDDVHSLIRENARIAVSNAKTVKPFKIEAPVEIQIEYFRNDLVDGIKEREGVKKVGPRKVLFTGDNIIQAFWRVLGG